MLHKISTEELDKLLETQDYNSYSWFDLQNEKKARTKLDPSFAYSITYRENLIRDTAKQYKDFVKWARVEINKTRYPHEIPTSEADVKLFELYNNIAECMELTPKTHELWRALNHTNIYINKMFAKSNYKPTTYGLEEYEWLSFDSRAWPFWTFLQECGK